MRYLALFALLATAACGVDGPPVANSASETSGVTISGCVAIGISNVPSDGKGPSRC
jgi:hypothetical protein